MGCCSSIPHSRRRYRYVDPADLDEEIVPIREFGNFRNGTTNLVPDDIDGLPSTDILHRLATNPGILLYEAELDQGRAFRCLRLWPFLLPLIPTCWAQVASHGLSNIISGCACDEPFCWLRKEYSTRAYLKIYPNRIETNNPSLRVPWGVCGCGSWNADAVVAHPFDRGAFGFRSVRCCVADLLCCTWPVYGGVLARQRCPCNGPPWPRILDCGGWWCDEWICDISFCSYRYFGIADAEETAFAAGIALQAYFENRRITKEDMDKCIAYWRENVSEMGDPIGRKRDVCCEPIAVPFPSCSFFYEYCCHVKRPLPYEKDDPRCTDELAEVYDKYAQLRVKQIERYKTYTAPVQKSTICRAAGCRRIFGRRGLIFCTEGSCLDGNPHSTCFSKKSGDPAPPFTHRDIDDMNDASVVLRKVLGDPPANVRYRRWEWNEETNEMEIVVHGALSGRQQPSQLDDNKSQDGSVEDDKNA
ncbi:hypothetical protein HJC23_000657 [Cyclotella cryptica]|uniref:Uncharacterized protein n=1 Tax=Cyclotella cryptica TaxID=29204 RepID=A0ABD3Q8G2_9STRA|eukprot:CCRYP_008050-RA/>CCRYP_008050-RA protein AED:0.24 eAED:0.24 QI:95/1/0.9/1/0.33/0.3/10/1400/472